MSTGDIGVALTMHDLGSSKDGDYLSKPKRGLGTDIINEMSSMKGEPAWMRDSRLTSFDHFENRPMPNWGGDLSAISFDDIFSYITSTENRRDDGETERPTLPGTTAQNESAAVYHRNHEALARLGVIFCDMDTALRDHPELVREHFGTVIPPDDNKFSSLNSAVWSRGNFIYVPPGIHVDQPLQAYFRADAETMGQFERTLIIADQGSSLDYIEGCSAPVYTSDSLHSAVVEVVVQESAHVGYTTIQNWSNNVFNLVTKRAKVHAEGHMKWIDGNFGSRLTMTYPSVILAGAKASGDVLSVAYAGKGQHQDTGAKMMHAAPETTSKVVNKFVCSDDGRTSHRGLIHVAKGAHGCKSLVERHALLLDEDSVSDMHPHQAIRSPDAIIGHEETVSTVADEQLFYLMSRGLSEAQAMGMIVNGFIEQVTRTLPMEYAVEWSRLIELQMEGSVG